MQSRRSLLANNGGRRASVAVASGGSQFGSSDCAFGGAGSRGGAGGAVVKITMIVTEGGDLRRVSLWPCRSADFVWSCSLDMEEECPTALDREWANVSSDELTL